MPRALQEVPGGVVWWLRPILGFSLSLSQAEQYNIEVHTDLLHEMCCHYQINLNCFDFTISVYVNFQHKPQ